jgi:hypothetical protein
MSFPSSQQLETSIPSSVYHLTHIDNVTGILRHGLLTHNNPYQENDISDLKINATRQHIHDYAPLFFNPRNAMLYRVQKEHGNKIVILEFNADFMTKQKIKITNGNAASRDTEYFDSMDILEQFNWNLVFSQSWNGYPSHVKQAMLSEVLVYKHLDIRYLQQINCLDKLTQIKLQRTLIQTRKTTINTVVDTSLFF